MSSQPRTEPNGSKPRHPTPNPAPAGPAAERRARTQQARTEDVLAEPVLSSDDTPTIISKNSPVLPGGATVDLDGPGGVRGRRLAHFELIEPIGVGGMAAVLRARDTQLDRFVALKILPPEMASDPENIRRFHQEARSAAKLDHENIARVFFCGEDQRLHFIAFEFVEGENLRTVLERRGRLPVSEALHYMLQVAAGLAHAAQRGVVHRDIKPSNIIIMPSGRAKLVDMGLARSMERKGEADLTQSGVTLGTFDYISPEQALEPREADVRSDIYSLGCTFYHALTGRPPVPEGTAAKKLHCHQHVKPPDPRQDVPELSLEVVLILDRMMAKNARDRFQTPEELVHKLLLAARHLGINPEVPEGVLTFEATVPVTPAGRPLLWIALAAVAVVLLVLFLDPMTPAPSPRALPAPAEKDASVTTARGASQPDRNGPAERPLVKQPDPTPADCVYTVGESPDLAELQKWLAARVGSARIKLLLVGDLNLSPAEGLLVKANEVIIQARDPGARPRPTIRLNYDLSPTPETATALTIVAARARIEGVRFIVDGHESKRALAALHLQGGVRHTIGRCEFIQVGPRIDQDNWRMASLLADSGRSPSTSVILSECLFLGFREFPNTELGQGGQDAVVRKGSVRLTATNCAFGPHSAAFRLEGGENNDDEKVVVQRCSVLLPGRAAAVFELPGRARARLEVEHCLFSRLDTGDGKSLGTVLVRQEEASDGAVTYKGRDNCYHDLDGYWEVGGDWQQAGWSDFRRRYRGTGTDESRLVLVRPWLASPERLVALLQAQRPGDQPLQAFHPNPRLTVLHEEGEEKAPLVGAGEPLLGKDSRPPVRDDKPAGRSLIVEKTVEDGAPIGIYKSLELAVLAAQPGDTILIRHNGELDVEPILLNKKSLGDLTIRPARGFQPLLTVGETSEKETALFRLQDGKLRLEDLEFRIRPPAMKRPSRLALVDLAGDGLCVLRRCVVTLERQGEMTVALATLGPVGNLMRLGMPPRRTEAEGPWLQLDGCFIRGEGDLLTCKATQACRPCELELKNSLVALSGTLLNLEVGSDAKAASTEHKVKLTLSKTTTYLGGQLVRLAWGKNPRAITAVECKAEKCLFLPATTSQKLILLEGADTDEEKLRDKFGWQGGPNAYGGYTALLQHQNTGGDGMSMSPLPETADKWKSRPSEDRSEFGLKPSSTISTEARLGQLQPGAFLPPRRARDLECGCANPSKLPQPRRP